MTGATEQQHLENLRLFQAGISLKCEKCRFFESEVEHLGHVIDANGVQPSPHNARVILEAPSPIDLKSLESWLCSAQYYMQFVEGFSTIAGHLNELRKQNAKFVWTAKQQLAFEVLKAAMTNCPMLVHYDDQLPIALATDVSPYGVGAVLFHAIEGRERPIAYASHTLSDAEQRYGEIEREGTAIIFRVKQFEKYLFGRRFKLYTDHRPLTHICHPSTAIALTSLQRIQRWSQYLLTFDYEIIYRTGKDNFQADAMS